jgi:serine/threonine-protein kinase
MRPFPRGTRFADHLILGVLGSGEMAHVYEALAPGGRHRALKVLNDEIPLGSKLAARFAQEAEAAGTIDHVNVARVFASGVTENRPWMQLELVAGKDLGARIRDPERKLTVVQVVRIVGQACEGVMAAHALGILHRDLKPADILVTDDHDAKVTDFGLAKLRSHSVQTTRDQEGRSALHMAPEHVRTGVAGPKGDVYGLGLVLYEALTGENPIERGMMNMASVVQRQLTLDPPPLATLGLEIPPALSDLTRWCLVKDPDRRCSPRELRDALAYLHRELDVDRRRAALHMSLPGTDPRLARTEPVMAAFAGDPGDPTPSPSPQLPQAGGEPEPERFRSVWIPSPPPPRVSAAELPSTLRSPSEPTPTPARPPATIKMDAVTAPAERRSTGIPVEQPAAAAPRGRRSGVGAAIGVVAVVLAGGVATAGWLVVARAPGASASAAASTAPATTAAATTTPAVPTSSPIDAPAPAPVVTASAGAPPPKPSAAPAPAPARRRTAPGKPRLPSP